MATANDLLRVATAELGKKGVNWWGNSQDSLYCRWYPMKGYWCAMFVSWCAAQSGNAGIIPKHAYTPSGADWFKKQGRWHAGKAGIRPGDIVYFKWTLNRIHHVGIVERVNANGTIQTIEGNTSVSSGGSQGSGGQVARKTRSSGIVGYGRPAYSGGTTPAPPAQAGKLAEDGWLGAATISRWQEVLGTPRDGVISQPESTLVRRVQEIVKAAGCVGLNGKPLTVDGRGIYTNVNGKTPKTNTQRAVQKYLGGEPDGVFDAPSNGVVLLQRRLNAGKF